MSRFFKNIILFVTLMVLSAGCADDTFTGYGSIPDGETTVDVELDFVPFSSAMSSRSTNAPAGDAISELSDIVLVAYKTDGSLADGFPKEINGYNVTMMPRNDLDASNGVKAEDMTAHTSFKLDMPYGEYYIFAISNIGSYAVDASGKTSVVRSSYQELTSGKYDYSSPEAVRRIKVEWKDGDIVNNREMMGFLTTDLSTSAPDYTSSLPRVRVDRPGITMKTWLRRCASKVTIDFDGSNLRDNVYLYIHRATVHDIPVGCTLGFGTEVDDYTGDVVRYNNVAKSADDLLEVSSWHIDYGETSSADSLSKDFESLPRITKGRPYLAEGGGSTANPAKRANLHSQTSPALYFYENMQGQSEYQKQHDPDFNTLGAVCPEEKEGMVYATFIEVEAFYRSSADGNVSEGTVRYRFLIGKDVKTDCNAERNTHYRVTLLPRGNANEYSWHIDYDEQGPIEVPDPWYVSYLYNHDSMMPFKVSADGAFKPVSVSAEIVYNPWQAERKDAEPGNYGYNITTDFTHTNKGNDFIGNGFLSLYASDQTVLTFRDCGKSSWPGYNSASEGINDNYYLGKTASAETGEKRDHSKRTYYFNGTSDPTNKGRNQYTWERQGDKIVFNVPLFTREKVLVKQTGFTGSNPYSGERRIARLKISAVLSNGTETRTISRTIPVIQVKRILNPSGIYRRNGNNEDFDCELKELVSENSTQFNTLESDGPWSAEVYGDKNFIKLDGKNRTGGDTGSDVRFNISFNKTNVDKNSKTVRNAVVVVRYHTYTCTHVILVRQGYEPQALCNDAYEFYNNAAAGYRAGGHTPVKWETFNMIHKDIKAWDPRDEGSLFHFGDLTYPYDAEGNIYNLDCVIPKDFVIQEPLKITQADTTTVNGSWNPSVRNTGGFTDDHVATIRHMEQLYLTPAMEFKYGVLYADGAVKTASTTAEAYGWYRRDTPDKVRDAKGMRGVFVYNWNENEKDTDPYVGRNMFFPIGRQGYGHRKNGSVSSYEFVKYKGVLRYAANRYQNAVGTFATTAPLFCNIYIRPGAIYWNRYIASSGQYTAADGTAGDGAGYGIDFNFFTMDIGSISAGNIDSGSDACFVRCVRE